MTGIIDLSQSSLPSPMTVGVCVVGSGPGGSTVARALARAGREVVVVEEGGDYRGMKLTQRDGQMYDQLYADRGGRSTADMLITVLQGRALGGGSVINASDVVPIPPAVLSHWRDHYGLTELTDEAIAPHEAHALEDLSANQPTEAQLNRNNRLLRDGAAKLGLAGEVMQHNRVGCAGLGTCLIGCPVDAKRNARLVAIPQAIEAGARVLVRGRVAKIGDANAELKTVSVERLDEGGHHPIGELEIRAKTVVVAASAIGSAQLLLRSGIGNDNVGRNLMLQPQLPITATFAERVEMFNGIPQLYAVIEHEDLENEAHGWWGYRIETIGGTPGIVSTVNPAVGPAGKTWMTRYAYQSAALLLVPDTPNGSVEVESNGRMRLHYQMPDEQRDRYRHAAKTAARIYLEAGAKEVQIPSFPPVVVRSQSELKQLDALELRPASTPMLSAHQMGTIRMAPDEARGAAAPNGEIYGTKRVFAVDSALFPTSASSHIMAPIMTIASHLATQI